MSVIVEVHKIANSSTLQIYTKDSVRWFQIRDKDGNVVLLDGSELGEVVQIYNGLEGMNDEHTG